MPEETLFINTLTFDYPNEKLTFYFSLEDRTDAHYTRLFRSNFPKGIKSALPQITDSTDFIYTTFIYAVAGLATLDIDLKTENPDFAKQYYNDQIRYYFKKRNVMAKSKDRVLIKKTYIKDNQIWVRIQSEDT